MNAYLSLVSLHVAAAIFGLGPLSVLALSASRISALADVERMARQLRIIRVSLLVMFTTGAGLIAMTRGALGETGWMRVSFGLFVVLGILHGVAYRRVRRALGVSPFVEPRATAPMLWAMLLLVLAITYLMEAKPW
jgi:uncharacterized membrane protein